MQKFAIVLINGFNPEGDPRIEVVADGIYESEQQAHEDRAAYIAKGADEDCLAVVTLNL